MSNSLQIPEQTIREGAERFGTPFWLYDRATIEARVREVQVFDVVRFAQKACSNLSILSLMRKLGVVVDAVSAGEIVRVLRVCFQGGIGKLTSQIVYTADIFDADVLVLVKV